MKKITDLTQGSIVRSLWIMAVPLISSSFIQMAYSMTDMLWLGHLGSDAVAAVGAAGFFVWLCNALSYMTKTGAEITVSQSVGARDLPRAAVYANQAVVLAVLIGIGYAVFVFTGARFLTGFFRFETHIADQSVAYLKIVSPGIFFQIGNNTFSGLYNGQGDSKTPFRITAVGLVVNILLDPLLIYGYGPFPRLGSAGAAIATAVAQAVVYGFFARRIFSERFPLGKMRLWCALKGKPSRRIILLGLPVSMQNALFSMFSLTLAALAARWGAVGVAAQSIGSQIEALSWMTATGFSTALAAFTGQNYGAGKYGRIRKGYRLTLAIAGSIGLAAGILFFIFNRQIFALFIPEPEAVEAGGTYLKILALSQFFMVTELVTQGAFNGCGRTIPPSLTGILFTGARIPLAWYLCSFPAFGLTGIWWSITISSIVKGTVLPLWYVLFQRKLPGRAKIKEKIL